MPAVHRLFDRNTAGAKITKVIQKSVYVNNILASVDNCPVAAHGIYPHSSPRTANGSRNVYIENIPVNRQGDKDTCGHPRATGSPDVFVNG